MIRFSQEKVLLLHQLLIAETGGAVEVRDVGLLDGASGTLGYDGLLAWIRAHEVDA